MELLELIFYHSANTLPTVLGMNDKVQLALLVGCVAGKSIDPIQNVMMRCFFLDYVGLSAFQSSSKK